MLNRVPLLLLVIAVSLTTGCQGRGVNRISAETPSATVKVGDTLRVDLGKITQSVGERWHLGQPADARVLRDLGAKYSYNCDKPGCGGTVTWDFAATGKGRADLVFRFCYRSTLANCQPGPYHAGTRSIHVTVTPR